MQQPGTKHGGPKLLVRGLERCLVNHVEKFLADHFEQEQKSLMDETKQNKPDPEPEEAPGM